MNAVLDSLFTKFLPGWKTRITALLVALLGVAPAAVDPMTGGGLLHQFGVDAPGWAYSILYGLGLLGVGEKVESLKTALAALPKGQ